ncbi:secretion protein F [Anaeromicropila herbilytica]|uniref:Tight adherence protein C n=1 Tax=Anaeromicropila herbilytica TaxID=2785025 RepID=A0A7R7EIW4_9FIRM|nr:secretion protein F [Anaeromicropila herbilytica]BCN29534.1 hypothetical protein bsdtb5_08290 [Anaeromicropila herbilytica]
MLVIIQVTMVMCIVYGIYIIATSHLHLVSHKANKVADAFVKQEKKASSIEVMIDTMAAKLAPLLRLDSYKRKKLEADLKSLNIERTPEMYRAVAIVKSGMILLLLIPCFLIVPLFSIGVVFFSIFTYFKSENELHEKLRKKKEDIEFELPRFACTLKQELLSSRDVLTILENYKKNAGISMKKELDVTIADMRSGNYESALLRFEARISSTSLSDIIRGLIGVLRGDNNVNYFEMLSHDLDILEVQRLENIAMQQPGKIKKYLFLLLVCIMIMYFTILAVYALIMVGK